MAMDSGDGGELTQSLRRLEELIGALDGHPDPAAGEPARELVSLVLDLHGIGLAGLMAIVTKADRDGAILAQLVADEKVRAMLLLHGLHPDDMETRVRRAVERLRPHLGVHGLGVEVAEIAKGAVRLRVSGGDAPGLSAPMLWSLPGEIEAAIVEAAPDVETVVIEGPGFDRLAPSQAAE
jgi:Fe-S cluster biogenesis protein NfuA